MKQISTKSLKVKKGVVYMSIRNIAERYEILKAMHKLMCVMNDEQAYMEWICIVPDGADNYDLQEIADDDEIFSDCCIAFRDIMKRYGKYHFFIEYENTIF